MVKLVDEVSYIIAWISIFLYALVSLTSAYYYMKLKEKNQFFLANPLLVSDYLVGHGRFNEIKQIFFGCLAISAAMDVPLYVGCVANGGPNQCEWDAMEYSILRLLHILALCGYSVSLGIPLFLWSDVIYGGDGKLFSNVSGCRVKTFFRNSMIFYIIVELTMIVCIFIIFDPKKHNAMEGALLYAILNCSEACFITMVAFGWLICGIRLQNYLKTLRFRPEAERKIMFTVNMVMLTVSISYCIRAILVLSLTLKYWHRDVLGIVNLNPYTYIYWEVGTRWLPYIVSSLLLIVIMRKSEVSIVTQDSMDVTNLTGRSKNNFTSPISSPRESRSSYQTKASTAQRLQPSSSISTRGKSGSFTRFHGGGGSQEKLSVSPDSRSPKPSTSMNSRIDSKDSFYSLLSNILDYETPMKTGSKPYDANSMRFSILSAFSEVDTDLEGDQSDAFLRNPFLIQSSTNINNNNNNNSESDFSLLDRDESMENR